MQELRHTRIGSFSEDQAASPAAISAESVRVLIRPLLDAASHLRRVVIDAAGVSAVVHGQALPIPDDAGELAAEGGLVALVDRDSRLLALAEVDCRLRILQPRRVFVG